MPLTPQGTLASTPIGTTATVQIVKATVHGLCASNTGNRNIVNDFYFSCGLGQALNQAMSNAMTTNTPGTSLFYLALQRLHSDYTAPLITWQSLTNPLLPYFNDTTGYTGANAIGGNRLPMFNAFCVNLLSGTHLRNAVGKVYLGPVSEGDVTKEQVTTGYPTVAWNNVAAAGGTTLAIAGGGSLTPVIVTHLGQQSSFASRTGSTAYIRNFNIAMGVVPLDTPVPDVSGQIIYAPIVSANCNLDKYITHVKNRVMHARRSFSRRG
jgi:hypothetical protein